MSRKNLFSERRSEQQPLLVAAKDEQAQADYIVERVLEQREAGILLHHQAVLMRAAHHSDLLEIELGKRNIPFVKYGGLRFLEAAHVKDVLCILRWAENARDDLAGFRVLQLLPGIGPGPGMGRRLHPERGRRLYSLGHGDGEQRRDRGGAAAAVRRDDASARSPLPDPTASVLHGDESSEWRSTCVCAADAVFAGCRVGVIRTSGGGGRRERGGGGGRQQRRGSQRRGEAPGDVVIAFYTRRPPMQMFASSEAQ